MKIVGVGLNKTGTTTLGLCLRHWGYRHLSFDLQAFHLFKRRNFGSLIEIAKEYDSFEDWPWPLLYEQMDQAFPESKFILTTRRSPEVWFTSLCRHAERTGPTEYREHMYGHAMPHGRKAEHIQFYTAHNRRVQGYFAKRPDQLLTVCWETGDGWRELGNFLRLPVPALPFPHANRSPGPIRARLARIGRQIIDGVR